MPNGFTTDTFIDSQIDDFDPSLLSGFASTEVYNGSDFTQLGALYFYDYTLGGHYWRIYYQDGIGFILGQKVLFLGLWFGVTDPQTFSFESITREETLTFTEIDQDDENGQVRYSITPIGGGFVLAYNTTTYTDSEDAWDNDALQILHGVGADSESPVNMLGLLLGLMFLSIPDIPVIFQVFLMAPVYSSIAYLVWFFVKEVIPFV